MDLNSKSRNQNHLRKMFSYTSLLKMMCQKYDHRMNTCMQKSNDRHCNRSRSSKHHLRNVHLMPHQKTIGPAMTTLSTCLFEVHTSINMTNSQMKTQRREKHSRNVHHPRSIRKPPWTILSTSFLSLSSPNKNLMNMI